MKLKESWNDFWAKDGKPRRFLSIIKTLLEILAAIAAIIALWPVFFPPKTEPAISGPTFNNEGSIENSTFIVSGDISMFEQQKLDWLLLDDPVHEYEMAIAYCEQLDYSKGREYFESALEKQIKQSGISSPDVAKIRNSLGILYTEMANFELAEENLLRALVIFKNEDMQTEIAIVTHNLGSLYYILGDYEKSLKYNQEAVFVNEQMEECDNLTMAHCYDNIALTYNKLNEYDKALEWCQKASTIWNQEVGIDHPMTATTIAEICRNKGDYDTALKWLQYALFVRENLLGKDHPDTAESYNNIAQIYYDQGDYDYAQELFLRALEIFEKMYGENHPTTANSYCNIGAVLYEKGSYNEAMEYFQKAYKIRLAYLGSMHPKTKIVKDWLQYMYEHHTPIPFEDWLKTIEESTLDQS